MDKNTHNPWALLPSRNWKAACNTLDTLFYRELIQAEQRRHTENESLIQSAFTIRNNMLHSMKCLAENEGQKFGTQDSNSEWRLVKHICKILELPTGSITPF